MPDTRVSTGIDGLDEVLGGGLIAGRTYLLTGPAGTGKTTIGWHYLTRGVAQGEATLYVSFAEPESELRANAARSGFDVSKCEIVDLSPGPESFAVDASYDIFEASQVERAPTTRRIVEAIERIAPRRVFIDSMTSLRFLAHDTFTFRRQALGFLRFLAERSATVLVTSEATQDTPDDDLRFLCDGVLELDLIDRSRGIRATKFRGSSFRTGRHTLVLADDGAHVYPRLLPERHHANGAAQERMKTGNTSLDELLGGGIERGTITLVSGPTGVGKTTLGALLLASAVERGEKAALYAFDEPAENVLRRCESVKIPVRRMRDEGSLFVRQIEALRYGPDEFAHIVSEDVAAGAKTVMIDSISGYRMTMTGTENLTERLHALGRFLQNLGVTVILVDELRDLSASRISDVGISYLADNVIFLRYVERLGEGTFEIGKGIGVLKKRLGDFERQVRSFVLTSDGIQVGEPLPLASFFTGLPVADMPHPSV